MSARISASKFRKARFGSAFSSRDGDLIELRPTQDFLGSDRARCTQGFPAPGWGCVTTATLGSTEMVEACGSKSSLRPPRLRGQMSWATNNLAAAPLRNSAWRHPVRTDDRAPPGETYAGRAVPERDATGEQPSDKSAASNTNESGVLCKCELSRSSRRLSVRNLVRPLEELLATLCDRSTQGWPTASRKLLKLQYGSSCALRRLRVTAGVLASSIMFAYPGRTRPG